MSLQISTTRTIAALIAVALVTAGCSKGDSAESSTGAESFAQQVSITNCDRELTFASPPQRIVSLNGHVTEALIEIGAGDRIVGRAYSDNPPTAETAEQFNTIPSLSDTFPSAEQILDVNPDFVVGGMTSAFNEKQGRSRDALAEHGINTFLFSEYCGTGFPDIGLLVNDYTQLGRVLGVEDSARTVAEQISTGLDEVRTSVDHAAPVSSFFYDSGEDVPTTVGGTGVGDLVAEYSGVTNIFAEGPKPYFKTTWETVAERAPQTIVVIDYGDKTADQKIDFLRSQPLMATTPAVQQNRFVVVPLADLFESSRLVRSAQTIATAFHPGASTAGSDAAK
ncbi:ABC transporter substrate-binding protein [Rhodococcus sp. IEGM 1379]|uniref:ABC transporter substrate-binding protein n=1 Tax=Rhodococcus sp. IEGM 1379 TaxID=3047086 RepID=UPI0024B7322F|nr:ABC transporter substrate-binding protein [Rhodococcus sp. IEGM 1379]MDI9914717.1 ABC transporter substrate-binding protein [Rhodococcus sp. IEGM 1379]